eukprot:TRINITY_DN8607_c0_g1_i1.p1 TRINITY_DN8607_c0_g1~~TRINITY_DN8607_c0_g1_i1.p1  ORF type:complete len:158 (+),score=31.17 TRINITY_DN8607_c0_g1_i1:106-579(+)
MTTLKYCLLTLLLITLTFADETLSTKPKGTYCSYHSLLTYTTKVTLYLKEDTFNFRLDKDIHYAWCDANGFSYDEENNAIIVNEPYKPCMQRLLDEKLSGKMPLVGYDVENDAVTIEIDVIPLLGYSTTVTLTKEGCTLPSLRQPVVTDKEEGKEDL